MQSCKRAADINPAARKRLMADLKRLHEEPIPFAAAQPCSDQDITLWDGVIGVEMDVTHIGCVTVPLHFLIDFPFDYPQSAPNIGFSFDFEYRGGAQYIMPDGRLMGKKVICLDVLGNFNGVHTEWKSEVGTGWTAAYTVSTFLVQLQSVLCDLGNQMSQRERDVAYQSAVRFCEKNPSSALEILDEQDIREARAQKQCMERLSRACGRDDVLLSRTKEFCKRAGFSQVEAMMHEFVSLLVEVAKGGEEIPSDHIGGNVKELKVDVDTNICCFATGKLYTEALLGVGVSRERKNLATAGELLSKEAYDGGLRQSTNKTAFEFFLPVWINETHAAKHSEWVHVLQKGYSGIGSTVFQTTDEVDAILNVFPRLINQLIVEVMRPDAAKCEAIATFEALCNFWRTLRWLVDTKPTLCKRVGAMLSSFASSEKQRHKDNSPDLGLLLVLFTIFQGYDTCPSRKEFIDAYLDENSVRWVMWWQKTGTPVEPTAVFQATKVSRDICMFQMMVLDVVIGDVQVTLPEMEKTNCKLPDRIEKLQARWREQKVSTDTWAKYFEHIGATRPTFGSTAAWIQSTVERAAAKGPKYGGIGGQGKGSGDGKGGKGGKAKNGGKARGYH